VFALARAKDARVVFEELAPATLLVTRRVSPRNLGIRHGQAYLRVRVSLAPRPLQRLVLSHRCHARAYGCAKVLPFGKKKRSPLRQVRRTAARSEFEPYLVQIDFWHEHLAWNRQDHTLPRQTFIPDLQTAILSAGQATAQPRQLSCAGN
jgi:hypothetical protein